MTTYRSVILGCGGRSNGHARAYRHVERAEVTACCDRHPEMLEKFSAEFGLRAYTDLGEMIRREKPDLIHLVTAPRTRVDQMRLVDELKVPLCLVEKPIALGVRDWQALTQLEACAQTKFGVGAQFRYHPVLLKCQEAIRSGRLGKVLYIDSSAGGNICDQGVHVLDWAMSLLGDVPVTRVFGAASGGDELQNPVHPSPGTTVAQLKFANGVYGSWNLGTSAPRVVADPVYWRHCRVAAFAEQGRVLYEEFGRWEIVSPEGTQSGQVESREDWVAGNDLAQANLTNAMLDWYEDDRKPAGTHLKRALEQWNAILGLYASAVFRQPVDLPFTPPDDLWEKLAAAIT